MCPRNRLRRVLQGLRYRHNAERGRQTVHRQARDPGRRCYVSKIRSPAGRHRSDRLPGSAPRQWLDGRQDTTARHQGRCRQAQCWSVPINVRTPIPFSGPAHGGPGRRCFTYEIEPPRRWRKFNSGLQCRSEGRKVGVAEPIIFAQRLAFFH
jgi:hypothetical protein